jgi:hypothetical protein
MMLQAGGPAMLPGLERFDLATVAVRSGCGDDAATGDVVVCGARTPDRVVVLPEVADPPIRARIGLGGGASATLHGIQSTLPGGSGSGAAVTIRLPF